MDRIASFIIGVAAATILAVGPGAALAQPPHTTTPTTSPASKSQQVTATRGYGWQLFAADLVLTAVAFGAQRVEPAVALIFTGPVIHVAHGRGHAAVHSLLMRSLLPLTGLFIGAVTCPEDYSQDDLGCLDNAFYGFGIGALTAAGFDYLAFSRPPAAKKPARVQPAVTIDGGSASAGLRLSF